MCTLSRNGILDLAVDSAELLVKSLLGVVELIVDGIAGLLDEVVDLLLRQKVLLGSSLVTSLGHNLGVVGRATTVPSKKLKGVSMDVL